MDEIAARLRRLPADTLTALAFFSRLPVPPPDGAFDMKAGAGAWPVAGLVLAIGPALVLLLALAAGFPPIVAAVFALALLTALSGAMHEDGLADTFDGFGGGKTREDKLALMRDSRLGTFGALALVFTVVVKLAALSALALRPGHAALALVCAAVASRALALWHWRATSSARSEGMAQAAGKPDAPAFAIGLGVGGIAALILLAAFGAGAIIGLLLAAAGVGLFSALATRQVGGHTGDTIGAAQQLAEALLIAGLAIAGPSFAT